MAPSSRTMWYQMLELVQGFDFIPSWKGGQVKHGQAIWSALESALSTADSALKRAATSWPLFQLVYTD